MSRQIVCLRWCKVILVAFVWFSPVCVFKCLVKLSVLDDAKSHWLHLFGFSPLWVFKCLLNSLAREDRYVKSYANKDSCAAMLHCCFAASEMAFSESSQPPLLHCIATSLQSHIKWQSELKQYNSRCFVALLQYYIRCQSELKADPATSLLCYNLCQPEHNTSLAASLLRCNLI